VHWPLDKAKAVHGQRVTAKWGKVRKKMLYRAIVQCEEGRDQIDLLWEGGLISPNWEESIFDADCVSHRAKGQVCRCVLRGEIDALNNDE